MTVSDSANIKATIKPLATILLELERGHKGVSTKYWGNYLPSPNRATIKHLVESDQPPTGDRDPLVCKKKSDRAHICP